MQHEIDQMQGQIKGLEGTVKQLQNCLRMAPAHLRDPLGQAPAKRLKDDATRCLVTLDDAMS